MLIKELVANGNVLTTQRELAQYIRGFYECLYSTEPKNEEVCVAQVESFASIPKMVTEVMN